jgi:hypothetical protein
LAADMEKAFCILAVYEAAGYTLIKTIEGVKSIVDI